MSTIHHINKTVRFGTRKTYGGRFYSVYARINYHDGELTISGTEGPLASGNCLGSAGQISAYLVDFENFAPGWDQSKIQTFATVWDKWHLNHLRAACEHQRALGQTWETHPMIECDECGYFLGSEWIKEEIPNSVLKYLDKLPYSDKSPAWV